MTPIGKGRLEVNALGTQRWLIHSSFLYCDVCVVAGAADFKDAARLADGYFEASLLLQVFNELVAHLSCRAKKADVFLVCLHRL